MGKTSSYSCLSTSMIAAGAALALLTQSTAARADEVSASGKGVVGGALLGAEVVVITESLAGVKPAWAYLIGAVAGAGGGGVAGWQIQKNSDSQASMYLLAGGMALLIPAIVATLQGTSYQPPDNYTEDRPTVGTPVPEPPQPSVTPPPGDTRPVPVPASMRMHWQSPKLELPSGLLALDEGAFRVTVPAVELRPLYRPDELQMYGLEQKHELRVPVFAATF